MTYSNKFFIIPLLVFLFTIIPSCSQNEEIRSEQIAEDTINLKTITYLALGDSYTVGESVTNGSSFPAQLSAKIEENKNYKVNTTVIAQTGWRTDQLVSSIGGRESGDYNLVTLLIGVNNQFQSRPFSQYESEFTELLNKAISLAGNDPNKVVVLSIPDYYYTPYG
ncbi:GDSL-type esterase/lipase family protein [Maribacter litoralis]|uniref:GDSL-type esterase/lipase family protein n=1 Tax=Maribacter litoralis TaxID=2059726 RepID=UPI001FC96049|nr:GDSL-type esterase/lipase family protein [Maribacter litoralis]